MINFASLFNQFRGSANNVVNDLLDEENVPLSKLIDEDSFINEYKTGNHKLIEYMTYSKVKEMIEYITVVGSGDDKKRNFKFPLTASEILSADIVSITDMFLPEGKLYETVHVTVEETVQVEQDQQAQKKVNNSSQQLSSNDKQEQELNNLILQNEKEKQQQTVMQQIQKNTEEKQKTIISDALDQVPNAEPQQNDSIKQNDNEENVVQETAQQTPAENIVEQKLQQTQQQTEQLTSNKQTGEQKQQEQTKGQQKIAKKKIQKVQKVQKLQQVEVPPLVSILLQYFDQQVNYILTGYVCKVLTSLFNKRTNQMMELLFTNKNAYKLIAHIESRSVGEFLLKVLTHQSSKWTTQRATFFTFLLNKLSQNNSIHVLSNFSSFICETIVKAADNTKTNSPVQQFTQIFFTPQVVTIAIKNVMSDYENVSIYNAPILLTYLTNVPFTLPKDEKVIQQFKLLLEMFIDKSLQKLNVNHTERPKLGFGRIKIIEILSYILKENLIGSRQMFASKQNAFPILFKLCQNYEMNNVLHNEVVKLVALSFTDKLLSEALLVNNVLLNFLLTQSLQDVQIRKGTGKQKFRKGFIGHIVQMARLVQENAVKENQAATKILQSEDFDKVLSILVEKQVSEGNKNLGGFSLKRQLKSQVMFQKQKIISHYIDFLAHSPKPVFEAEPVHVNIEHPDFLQEMERQLEENLSLEEKPEVENEVAVQKQEASSQTPPLIQAVETTEIKVEINFFKSHLDYDIEKLMGDL